MSFPEHSELQFLMPMEPLAYNPGPMYPGPPYTASNLGTCFAPVIDRYFMHRGQWFFPESAAKGVPCIHVPTGVAVVGYRCDNCKRFFIAAELLDFEHGCTKDDYRP